MIRILGLSVALVAPLCFSATTNAQITRYDAGGSSDGRYGVSAYEGQPYGGFGLEYSQAPPPGGMVMDQYGLWHAVPTLESAPPLVAAAQPQPQQRSRTTRSASGRGTAQPRYELPTGSLGWSGANGGILYSPGTRYRSYGSGYGFGPYGVLDNSGMWHGMPSGY